MKKLSGTDLTVFPVCLGGNVFGWTADAGQARDVLDRYAVAGGNFIDTADSYSAWVPGNAGGESESIIGDWMHSRRNRHQMVIATKVGRAPNLPGLSAQTIAAAVEGSLTRLRTDHIDLYYAHLDDADRPLVESLGALDALVRAGKVRYIAASNYSADRFAEALALSAENSLAKYSAVQLHHNLVYRTDYDDAYVRLCERAGVSCLPYYALAEGFLTGKYRSPGAGTSPRAERALNYLDDRGRRTLSVLADIAAANQTTMAAVALAWLLAQPGVAAPIASARSSQQLDEWLPTPHLRLSTDDIRRLTAS